MNAFPQKAPIVKQPTYKYIFLRNQVDGRTYFITADSQGMLTSIYCLTDNMNVRGIFGTKLYVNYVVDTKLFFDSVEEAICWGYDTFNYFEDKEEKSEEQ